MRRQITTTPAITHRFLGKLGTSPDPDGCWEFPGYKITGGYCLFKVEGQMILAHRYAYTLAYGPIPDGLDVLHACDVPNCVNPRHLRTGSHRENMADMVAKGRKAIVARGDQHWTRMHPERLARGDRSGPRLHPERLARGDRSGARLHPETRARGERVASARVTAEIVRVIRIRCANGESHRVVAADYGISKHGVWAIVHRKTWAHID